MRIIFSSFIFFSYFLIFHIFHLISSFAPHLIATSSSSCSSRVLYLAECWTFCFLEVDGSVLKTLFHWFDHHFSVMRICVWGVRLDHSFQYWLISAVGQCGGGWAGARARPLALCEGYPNIVQACDDSKAGCANKRLVYSFSGPSGQAGGVALTPPPPPPLGERARGTPPLPTTCFYCTIAPPPRRRCTQYSAD